MTTGHSTDRQPAGHATDKETQILIPMTLTSLIRRSYFISLLLLGAGLLPAQFVPTPSPSTNVLTWRNNNWRDGLNSTETTLTQANVTPGTFGKICSTQPGVIDGQVFAQPLVVTGSIPGYNHVVYVVTMNDSIYFLDGDSTNCAVILRKSLLKSGQKAVRCADLGPDRCDTLNPLIGILGTPVIDTTTNTIYLVNWVELTSGKCASAIAANCFMYYFHALDITTGAEKFNGPVAIPAASSGKAKFTYNKHLQRPGLLLLPNVETNNDSAVYIAFSEMDGSGVVGKSLPSGWIFRYDAQNLAAAPIAWATDPTGEGGGIWLSGAGLAAGPDKPGGQNYLYVGTGDGTFDAENGGSNYGNSLVKLTPDLEVTDYFAPYGQYCDQLTDTDLGAGGVLLIPDGAVSPEVYFAIANGKDGNLYVLDRSGLGGYAGPASNTCPAPPPGPNFNVQTFQASQTKFYSTPGFWNQNLYSVPNNASVTKYAMNAACNPGPICETPLAHSAQHFAYGSNPAISSNNANPNSAILWIVQGNGWPSANAKLKPAPALLYAYDANHVTAAKTMPMLWSSSQCPQRDGLGNATKFIVPTVANGRVFVGAMDPSDPTNTKGQISFYGPTTAACK